MAAIPTCCGSVRNMGLPRMASFGYASSAYDDGGMPDPRSVPEAYEGVLLRRVLAYFVDVCIIGVLAVLAWIPLGVLWLLTLGLLGPLLWFLTGLIPLLYHTLLLSGRWSATFGMRLFDIELRSITGERPRFLQALIQTVVFYVTVGLTCWLVLLFALLNRHKRTLQDVLAGTVMVRRFPVGWSAAYDPWRA